MACFWTDFVGSKESCSGGSPPIGDLTSFYSPYGTGYDFGCVRIYIVSAGSPAEDMCNEDTFNLFANAFSNSIPVVITGKQSADGEASCYSEVSGEFDEVSFEMWTGTAGEDQFFIWVNDGTFPFNSDWLLRLDVGGVVVYGFAHVGG